MAGSGVSFIRPAFARRALDRVFAQSLDHVAVSICDWDVYATQVGRSAPFYDNLASNTWRRGMAVPVAVHAGALRTRPPDADLRRDRTSLLQALCEQVTSELGLEGNVDTRQPLQQLGVDSLMSVNLANRLEAALGVSVPVATLVRGPSLEQLADELLGDAGSESVAPSGAATPEPTGRAPRSETRGRGWLVFPQPNDAALARLFCFNYAAAVPPRSAHGRRCSRRGSSSSSSSRQGAEAGSRNRPSSGLTSCWVVCCLKCGPTSIGPAHSSAIAWVP